MARRYVLRDDAAKVRLAYPDFFAFWKDPDPEMPILKEAKMEYPKV